MRQTRKRGLGPSFTRNRHAIARTCVFALSWNTSSWWPSCRRSSSSSSSPPHRHSVWPSCHFVGRLQLQLCTCMCVCVSRRPGVGLVRRFCRVRRHVGCVHSCPGARGREAENTRGATECMASRAETRAHVHAGGAPRTGGCCASTSTRRRSRRRSVRIRIRILDQSHS